MKLNKPKILMVAQSNSVHVARWIENVADDDYELHLFPSIDLGRLHPDIRNVTVHHSLYAGRKNAHHSVNFKGLPMFSDTVAWRMRKMLTAALPRHRIVQLRNLVHKLNPTFIHSMNFQCAGYLTLEAKKLSARTFPKWLGTNWGNDIYLFGRLSQHRDRVRELLANIDYYSCECSRDRTLAREFGYKGVMFEPFPNAGGFDLDKTKTLRRDPPSSRKIIMVKGYQGWAGRALVALQALKRCGELIRNYEIVIYSVCPESGVVESAELLGKSNGCKITVLEKAISHTDMLSLHGSARISMSLAISDGVCTSMLEALVMGAYPIQSGTACADEWLENGRNGSIVPPEDPEVIERELRRALFDDKLVDEAARINTELAQRRLSFSLIRNKARDIYSKIIESASLELQST